MSRERWTLHVVIKWQACFNIYPEIPVLLANVLRPTTKL